MIPKLKQFELPIVRKMMDKFIKQTDKEHPYLVDQVFIRDNGNIRRWNCDQEAHAILQRDFSAAMYGSPDERIMWPCRNQYANTTRVMFAIRKTDTVQERSVLWKLICYIVLTQEYVALRLCDELINFHTDGLNEIVKSIRK